MAGLFCALNNDQEELLTTQLTQSFNMQIILFMCN